MTSYHCENETSLFRVVFPAAVQIQDLETQITELEKKLDGQGSGCGNLQGLQNELSRRLMIVTVFFSSIEIAIMGYCTINVGQFWAHLY